MLYALASNGSVGHVITSQSNEKSEVTTVCGKTLRATEVRMVEETDVCKQCDGKVEAIIEATPDVVVTEDKVETKVETKETKSTKKDDK